MSSALTQEHVLSTIDNLPPQGRIMLRLLFLQYLDVPQEDIDYMAADRPDPRRQAGSTLPAQVITREAIQTVADRAAQYRRQVRLRRERTWLQTQCLRKLSDVSHALTSRAEQLLITRFGLESNAVHELKRTARTVLPKPAMRVLAQQWEHEEITAEAYQRERLAIEFQTQLRLEERHRKRLELSSREYTMGKASPLQDHEIGHIWGIPAGSLAARKVKYIHQYLQTIQSKLQAVTPPLSSAGQPPLDLWRETFTILGERPVERSVATYDGLERTESALLEKLNLFAWGLLPEEMEGRFWLSLVHGGSSNAVHAEATRSLFGLQRLSAILADLDTSPESLEETLLARVTPEAKADAVALLEEPAADQAQLGEMGEHVLKSFLGEEHPDLHGRR